MMISYERMWKLLDERKITPAALRKSVGIAPNTMTKLRQNKPVHLTILDRICNYLKCDYGDIMQYIPDQVNKED